MFSWYVIFFSLSVGSIDNWNVSLLHIKKYFWPKIHWIYFHEIINWEKDAFEIMFKIIRALWMFIHCLIKLQTYYLHSLLQLMRRIWTSTTQYINCWTGVFNHINITHTKVKQWIVLTVGKYLKEHLFQTT